MDLTPYVTRLRSELDSAVRLTLIEALSAAADEITTDLAPGSVELRLHGRDADFLVTPPLAPALAALPPVETTVDGAMTRLNVRLPEALKARIDQAAAKEKISANVWLVRAAAAVLDS
ncbi:MAG TPA: toxin-antitoxin system HicB family antitoxin [Pseudonocardiaceae bacterium]|nr:toxin-antitoxin system HicB family antitoxin [Pseudonocardiaceae bacterium]